MIGYSCLGRIWIKRMAQRRGLWTSVRRSVSLLQKLSLRSFQGLANRLLFIQAAVLRSNASLLAEGALGLPLPVSCLSKLLSCA
jgi:hypothetical protein